MNLFIHSIPNWLELTFLAFSIGILISLLWVLPPRESSVLSGHEHLRSRMWLFLTISIFAMLICSVFDLMIRSAEMSGKPVTEVFPDIPTVISRTHYGSIWLIRTAVLVLTFIVLIAGRRRRESRAFLLFLFALASVVALTESASGHAADKGDFSVVELADLLHLLAASVWGGGLFTLSLTILPHLRNDKDKEALAGSASRFSRIAGIAVGVIVPTALYNAWIYAGSIDALVKSSYGWTIIAKIILLSFLLYLGAFNHYITVPLMRKAAGLPADRPGIIAPVLASRIKTRKERTAQGFSRSVRAEAFLMVGMMLCAALLRHEVPAKHYLHQHEKGVLHPHMH
ncbi:MAG: copper resistance D family protein [Nitrospirota bacterium]